MRFTLEAVSAEDRARIAKLNAHFHPRKATHNPCLDAKWKSDDGSAMLYLVDRTGGPGWAHVELALCVGDDIYRIDASWDDANITARYQVKARVFQRGKMLAGLSDDIRELAESAIYTACHYGSWMWLEDLPFVGADISFDAAGS